MPIIKSAKKRVRSTHKATARNTRTKRSLRGAIKTFSKTPSAKSHSSLSSEIDKALKKGVLHKNKAARLKKRAAAKAKASGVKNTKATAAKKAPAKKTTSKAKK